MGILPTKGLTLPLISYGSNSTIALCGAIGLVFRVGYEANPPPRRAAVAPAQPAAGKPDDE